MKEEEHDQVLRLGPNSQSCIIAELLDILNHLLRMIRLLLYKNDGSAGGAGISTDSPSLREFVGGSRTECGSTAERSFWWMVWGRWHVVEREFRAKPNCFEGLTFRFGWKTFGMRFGPYGAEDFLACFWGKSPAAGGNANCMSYVRIACDAFALPIVAVYSGRVKKGWIPFFKVQLPAQEITFRSFCRRRFQGCHGDAFCVGSFVQMFQSLGAEIQAAEMVARRVATTTCWQRGRSRVVGTFGGVADARYAD